MNNFISPEKKQEIANALINTQDSAYAISNKFNCNTHIIRSIGTEFMGDMFYPRENLAVVKMLSEMMNLRKTNHSLSQIATKLNINKSVSTYLVYKIQNNKLSLNNGVLVIDNEKGVDIEALLQMYKQNNKEEVELSTTRKSEQKFTFIEISAEENNQPTNSSKPISHKDSIVSKQEDSRIAASTVISTPLVLSNTKEQEASFNISEEKNKETETNTINVTINGLSVSYESSLPLEESVAKLISNINAKRG